MLAELRALGQGSDADGGGLEFVGWPEQADFYKKTVSLFGRQVRVIEFIIAVVILLSISNTMTMTVLERTGEVGTSLALGVGRRRILRQFLLEGLLIGGAGAAAGAAVGAALAAVISAIGIPMPAPPGMARGYLAGITLTWPLLRDALFMAVVAAALASVYPAWRVSRLPIVDALRHNR